MGGTLTIRSAGAGLLSSTGCGASVLWSWNEGGCVVVGRARCWVSESAAVVLLISWVLALVNSAVCAAWCGAGGGGGWLVVV
jgi:hypothetical protein